MFGVRVVEVTSVRYSIAAKTGAATKPVDVTYGIDALVRRGGADFGKAMLQVPVFGLSPGHANQVSIELTFADASVQTMTSR